MVAWNTVTRKCKEHTERNRIRQNANMRAALATKPVCIVHCLFRAFAHPHAYMYPSSSLIKAQNLVVAKTQHPTESVCTQVQVKQTLYLFIAIYKYNLIWTEKQNIPSISFRLALWNQKTSWHSLWLKSRQMSRPLCNIFLMCPCVLCPSSNKAAKWITNSHMVQGLCFDNWWLRNKVTLTISNFLGHPGVV